MKVGRVLIPCAIWGQGETEQEIIEDAIDDFCAKPTDYIMQDDIKIIEIKEENE